MNDFNIKQFLVENKMTRNSRLLKENISKFEDYISGMFDMSVSEKEGFQTGVWEKEEYASDAYEGTDFSDLSTYLGSVGGKATLEGNPDITVKLLDSGDIKWSADVTLDENLNEEASNGFDIEFQTEYGDALVITHDSNPDVNIVITEDKEELNQETVTASGEFVLGGKTLYWFVATA